MMPELSLNVLDVAQNSVTAGATLVTITASVDTAADTLTLVVSDNGCGMTPEQVARVTDPFFTTRTTRKVGLGVPFFKMAAELSGGSFSIVSEQGKGTTTTAVFGLRHIDRMPLGNMGSTLATLIGPNPALDFVYTFTLNGEGFTADTREFRAVLEGAPLNEAPVLAFIQEFIEGNTAQLLADAGDGTEFSL